MSSISLKYGKILLLERLIIFDLSLENIVNSVLEHDKVNIINIILGNLQLNLGRFTTFCATQLFMDKLYLNKITRSRLQSPQPKVAWNIGSNLLNQILPSIRSHLDILLRLLIYTVYGTINTKWHLFTHEFNVYVTRYFYYLLDWLKFVFF